MPRTAIRRELIGSGLFSENSRYATIANGNTNNTAGKIKLLKNKKNATAKRIYERALLIRVKIIDQKNAFKTLRNAIEPQYIKMLYCDEIAPVNQ